MRKGKKGVRLVLASVLLLAAGAFLWDHLSMLAPGDTAPRFTARLSDGRQIALTDFLGRKNVVLFFYPADFTPGCTREVCAYRDGYREFDPLDAVLFGISANDDSSHARFATSYRLPFPLIADTDRSLARAFHVRWLGGLVPFTKRVTFVIDKKGVIRLVAHHEFAIERHLEDVIGTLRDLKKREDAGGTGVAR